MSYNPRRTSEFDDDRRETDRQSQAPVYEREEASQQKQQQQPSLYEHYQQQIGQQRSGNPFGHHQTPQAPQSPGQYGGDATHGIPSLSNDDIRILRTCNKESFYYRCLPLAASGCMIVYFLSAKRNMKAPVWQYISTAFAGWLVGKISYRKICEDKLANSSSNSPLVQAIRRRRGMHISEYDPSGKMPVEGETYSDWDTQSFDKSDNQSSGIGEFDDEKKSTSSNTQLSGYESEEKKPQLSTSYDDLRAKNRAAYGVKM